MRFIKAFSLFLLCGLMTTVVGGHPNTYAATAQFWELAPCVRTSNGHHYIEWNSNASYTGGYALVWAVGVESDWYVACNSSHIIALVGNTTPLWGAYVWEYPSGSDNSSVKLLLGDSGNTTAIDSQPAWSPDWNLSDYFTSDVKVAWGMGVSPFYTGDPGLLVTVTETLLDYAISILVGVIVVLLAAMLSFLKRKLGTNDSDVAAMAKLLGVS
jgi:hypothetical protein